MSAEDSWNDMIGALHSPTGHMQKDIMVPKPRELVISSPMLEESAMKFVREKLLIRDL